MDRSTKLFVGVVGALGIVFLGAGGCTVYSNFRINVPSEHIAVILTRTGEDLENDEVVAPDLKHKGLQKDVLNEGRYFYNPWYYDWNVYPMVTIPSNKLGVRVRLYGENLPYAHFLATTETQKGIVADVLLPGRYPINAVISGEEATRPAKDYAEIVQLFDPVTVPAGFRGIVTNLAGPMPADPNGVLSPEGFRGVQQKTLDAGTHYFNPYMFEVDLVDCRSQRFNMTEGGDIGFPSKDGFWVTLDGIIEFRVDPERAAEVFVLYNEIENDVPGGESNVHEEIVRKIVMQNARSFCRLRGSNSTGREFIGGETRTAFQKDFADAMHKACDPLGVEIVQALITKIQPPQAIADPVRKREISAQEYNQYVEQVKQQEQEALLATEKALILQKQALVGAEQKNVQKTTTALQKQEVARVLADQGLAVAEKDLLTATNTAAATLAKAKAEAGIIVFNNEAEAAGWKRSVEAFGGDGGAYARYALLQRLAPSYRRIMSNSADSPLMAIFEDFQTPIPLDPNKVQPVVVTE